MLRHPPLIGGKDMELLIGLLGFLLLLLGVFFYGWYHLYAIRKLLTNSQSQLPSASQISRESAASRHAPPAGER